jgi:hypothetical protein
MVSHASRVALALVAVAVAVACGTAPDPGSDVASVDTNAPRDAVGTDVAAPDGGGATDVRAMDTGRPDVGATDVRVPPSDASGTVAYSTDFDLTESRISEGGRWHRDGLDWTAIETFGGLAAGTQALGVARSGPGVYNDSYAYLTGFPASQQASAVVHLASGVDTGCTHEVEILLRWADAAHTARGYECNLAYNGGYAEVVRWNGPVGDYTYVAPQGSGGPGAVHDGDVFTAQIVGNVITTALNGRMLQRVDVTSVGGPVWSDGNPGIGMWRGTNGCGARGDYAFTHFAATSLPP